MAETTYNPGCFEPDSIVLVTNIYLQQGLYALYVLNAIAAILLNINAIVIRLFSCRSSSPNLRRGFIITAYCDIALAIMMLYAIENYIYANWRYSFRLCLLAQSGQLLVVFIERIVQTVIATERYLAIAHPFSIRLEKMKKHNRKILGGVVIAGALYGGIPTDDINLSPVVLKGKVQGWMCAIKATTLLKPFMILNFTLTFLLSACAITFSGVVIMRENRKSERRLLRMQGIPGTGQPGPNGPRISLPRASNVSTTSVVSGGRINYKQANRMIFWTIIIDNSLWAGIKLWNLFNAFGLIRYCEESGRNLLVTSYIICHFLAAFSTVATPILHLLQSETLRKNSVIFWLRALQSLAFWRYCRRKRREPAPVDV